MLMFLNFISHVLISHLRKKSSLGNVLEVFANTSRRHVGLLFIFQNSLEQEILNPTLLTPDLCKFEVSCNSSSDLPVSLLIQCEIHEKSRGELII